MIKFLIDLDFSNYTFIVPSVSVGNAGQLAADLLISSMNMQNVAKIWSPGIVPIVGGNPYDLKSESLTMSCELYACQEKKLLVLQLRSPIVKKYAETFLNLIAGIAKQHAMQRMIILSSTFASEKRHISTDAFRFISNNFVQDREEISKLNWVDFTTEPQKDVIHGSGFAKNLYDICVKLEVACVLLFKYCSEGDNIPDAVDIVTYLNNYLRFHEPTTDVKSVLKYPPSWILMFGNKPPNSIY